MYCVLGFPRWKYPNKVLRMWQWKNTSGIIHSTWRPEDQDRNLFFPRAVRDVQVRLMCLLKEVVYSMTKHPFQIQWNDDKMHLLHFGAPFSFSFSFFFSFSCSFPFLFSFFLLSFWKRWRLTFMSGLDWFLSYLGLGQLSLPRDTHSHQKWETSSILVRNSLSISIKSGKMLLNYCVS